MTEKSIDIQKLAQLARIEITEAEAEKYATEIASILGYVDRIQKADTNDVRPADREAGAVRNVFREDVSPHEAGAFSDELLAEAPDREGDFVKVKKIL